MQIVKNILLIKQSLQRCHENITTFESTRSPILRIIADSLRHPSLEALQDLIAEVSTNQHFQITHKISSYSRTPLKLTP